MILLYTGAGVYDNPQPLQELSLGGYPSNTIIANSKVDAIFGPISKTEVVKNLSLVRMIVLKNITSDTISNIKVWTKNYDDSLYRLKIAVVAPATDSCNNPIYESLVDQYSLPYQAELAYKEAEDNAITIANLAAGEQVGIWLKREILLDKFPDIIQSSDLDCDALADLLLDNSRGDLTKDLGVDLKIKW